MIQYSVVGLLYTRTCPLSCRHCIISSSPKEKDKMRPETAHALLEQIPPFSSTVCFTGGEPLLYYHEIVTLIEHAVELGLRPTLVTGAGWVSQEKPEIARSRIERLQQAGLNTLCVSWDTYHEEYSRPENAWLLIQHAKSIGLPVTVRGVTPALGIEPAIEKKLVQIDVNYERVPVIRLGHGASLPEEHFHFSKMVNQGGCSTVVSPVVEPDGNVYACCGPSRSSHRSSPLVLGNLANESLDAILTRGTQDPLLEAIHHIGPFGLYQLVKENPDIMAMLPNRQGYTGICELCLDFCDRPEIVAELRRRLAERDARAMVAAAGMLHRYTSQLPLQA